MQVIIETPNPQATEMRAFIERPEPRRAVAAE